MNYSCLLWGTNGYRYSLSDDNDLSSYLKKYNSKKYTINCVAVGGRERFAVTCNNNAYGCRGPQKFLDKMSSLTKKHQIKNIKHITFGPGDTWAIVMNSGFCYFYCYYSPHGPKEVIDKNNNDISYVSMNSNKGQWIVGGKNHLACHGLDNVGVDLGDIIKDKCSKLSEIKLIEIGEKTYYIKHSNNGYCVSLSTDATSYCIQKSEQLKDVSLW